MAHLGRYTLSVRVDRGEDAPCFIAFDSARVPVSLRAAPPLASASAEWLKRFIAWGTRASALEHPSILGLREVSVDQGRPFAVYAPEFGVPLSRLIEFSHLEPERWNRLAADLLDGMDHLHARGVCVGPATARRVLASFRDRFLWVDPSAGELSLIPEPELSPASVSPESDLATLGAILESCRPACVPREPVAVLLHDDPKKRSSDDLRRWVRNARTGSPQPPLKDRFRRLYSVVKDALQNPGRVPAIAQGGSGHTPGALPLTRCGPHRLGPRVAGEPGAPLVPAHGPDGRQVWLRLDLGSGRLATEAENLRAWASRRSLRLREANLEATPPHLVLEGSPAVPFTIASRADMDICRRLAWVKDLTVALLPFHAEDMIYGALHAGGVGVTAEGEALLLDMSRVGDGDVASVQHDPLVLAPEVYGTKSSYGTPGERFALGCLVYQTLTGTRPFRALEPRGLRRALTQRDPIALHALAPETPAEVVRVVQRLLSRRPEDRPQLEALIAAIEEGLQAPSVAGAVASVAASSG